MSGQGGDLWLIGFKLGVARLLHCGGYVMLCIFLKIRNHHYSRVLEVRYNHWARLLIHGFNDHNSYRCEFDRCDLCSAFLTQLMSEFNYELSLAGCCWALGAMATIYVR